VPQLWFFMSIAFSFIVWGIVTARYVWQELRLRPRAEALRPLLTLHSFRFIGLAFLVPGVVSPDLPGVVISWVFGLWGSAGLFNAFYQAIAPGSCQGSWEPPTSFRLSSFPCC
jgi:hypothetical protein